MLRGLRRAAPIVLVAGLAVLTFVAGADARLRRTWSARVLAGPPGSSDSLLRIADDGQAVGVMTLADGTIHGIYFNGHRLIDMGPRLGAASSLTDINDRHEMVGYLSSNPAARAGNIGRPGADPSTMPRAFFRAGSRLQVLPFPSVATAVNLDHVVGGYFLASDGSVHAFTWKVTGARLTAHSAQTPAGLVDHGPGTGADVSDPLVHVRGHPELFGVDERGTTLIEVSTDGGRTWRRRFARDGFQTAAINDLGQAAGGRAVAGGERPSLFDLLTGRARSLVFGSPFASGTAAGNSDSGLTAGVLFTASGQATGALWNQRGHALILADLRPPRLPREDAVFNGTDVNINGQTTGIAHTRFPGNQVAVILDPPLTGATINKFDDFFRESFGITQRDKLREIRSMVDRAGRDRRVGCQRLERLRQYFLGRAREFSGLAYARDAAIHQASATRDLEFEIPCE